MEKAFEKENVVTRVAKFYFFPLSRFENSHAEAL